MDDESRVRVRDRDGLVHITLARPPANAIDLPMAQALAAAAPRLADARVVLLDAEGASFCMGGDVAAFGSADARGRFIRELADTMHRFNEAMASTDAPVVAATTGWAVGAGLSFLLGADIVIAGEGARFGAAYAGIGLTPDGGMSRLLVDRIGPRPAMDLLLTGRRLDAAEALAHGLVTRVVADDAVTDEAAAVVATLLDGPVEALRTTKRLVREADGRSFAAQLAAEAETIATRAEGAEGREGVDAFLAKRTPDYRDARMLDR